MNNPQDRRCRVLIFDDEPDKAKEWCERISALGAPDLQVSAPPISEIQSHLDALYARRQAIDSGDTSKKVESALDDTEVLVVDYDLRHLEEHRGFATGEEIAYSARLFSCVKIIVVVNHPNIGLDNFDLTLQRDRDLRADVYVGHEQIANPGLWRVDARHDGFLPWSWSVLTEDVGTFEQCLAEVRDNFQKPLLNFFGLDQPDARPSPEMLAFLGIKRDEDVAFADLLTQPSTSFLRRKDLEGLIPDEARHTHVLTALLRKWFRRWVLPAQSLLADLPHLAVAVPWGLSDYRNADVWNRIAVCGRSSQPCDLSTLLQPQVLEAKFSHDGWAGRPAFLLRRARAALESAGTLMADFDLAKSPNLSFAEDLSRFILADQAVEYSLTLDGQPQTRAVCAQEKVQINDRTFDPSRIVYSPQSLIV